MVNMNKKERVLDLENTAKAIDKIRNFGIRLCFQIHLSLTKKQLLKLCNSINEKCERLIERNETEYFSRFLGLKEEEIENYSLYGICPNQKYLSENIYTRYDDVRIYSTFDNRSSSDIIKTGFLRAYELIENFNFIYPDLVSLTKPSYPPRGIWKQKFILSVEDIRNHPRIRECKKRLNIVNKYYPKLIDLLKKL